MAKRMALVPESWLKASQQQQGLSTQPQSSPPPSITIVEPPKQQNDLTELAQLLPKSYRSRARILLHYLEGHLKLNPQQRVLYPPNDQLGSHILDLVKYYVSTFPTDRPLDAPKFAKLMTQAGVPTSAIAKKTQPMSNKWQRL